MRSNKRILGFILCIAVMVAGLFFLANRKQEETKETIVASNFFTYDITRALIKDTNLEVEMLTPAGKDLHHFEPNMENMVDLKNTKLIAMNGGESEEWLLDIVEKFDEQKVFKAIETKGLKCLNEKDSAEVDEHIWTSPKNAAIVLKTLGERIEAIYPEVAEQVHKNYSDYESSLYAVDNDFTTLAKNAPRRVLILADRNSMAYFFDEYGLDYIAAFPGCSEDTEANPSKIARISNTMKSQNTQIVFQTEFENSKIAKQLGAKKVLTLQTMHTVSEQNFNEGKTYIDLMQENYYGLREFYNAN